jgi:hypothetical protein
VRFVLLFLERAVYFCAVFLAVVAALLVTLLSLAVSGFILYGLLVRMTELWAVLYGLLVRMTELWAVLYGLLLRMTELWTVLCGLLG